MHVVEYGALRPSQIEGQAFENLTTNALVLGDLDLDGGLDLVEGSDEGGRVLLNDGTAQFLSSTTFFGPKVLSEALGDLDGDGDLDLVTGNEVGAMVWPNQTF